MKNYQNIAIIASPTPKAQEMLVAINARYNFIQLDKAPIANIDLIIVLGGDGFILHCLHSYMHLGIPIYGMNCGSIGFLLNNFDDFDLINRINHAAKTIIHPLEMTAKLTDGEIIKHLAINEVSIFRKTSQAAKIKITIDNEERIAELVCDGVLVATPAGSSAYNASVNGPIMPIGSNILALTPISPFRPRRWRGALLPHTATIELTILDQENRQVNAVADFLEVSSVTSVTIKERRDIAIALLFDPNHSLEERIIKEQFLV